MQFERKFCEIVLEAGIEGESFSVTRYVVATGSHNCRGHKYSGAWIRTHAVEQDYPDLGRLKGSLIKRFRPRRVARKRG